MNHQDQSNARELLATIHFIAKKGWAPATSTNHSMRLSLPGHFLVSRSGVDKPLFSLDDFVQVDAQGQLQPPTAVAGARPSAETELHLELYRRFPEVGCVLHTHSPLGTWWSRHGGNGIRFQGWEILKGLEGNTDHEREEFLPVVPNSQRMADILRSMENHWDSRPRGFLIAGHGLYTWGRTVAEARRHVETWEFLLQMHHWERTKWQS